MRIPGRLIAGAAFMCLIFPVLASAYDRDHREREAAFQSGFDRGYRAGLHNGISDARMHFRFDYRGRDRIRDYGMPNMFRYKGDFNKGFRDGYRRGYREGYDRLAFPRRWQRFGLR